MIYNELIKEEFEEQKQQLENKNKLLEEQQNKLEEQQDQLKDKQKKIEFLQNKPDTYGFVYESGFIYLIKDTSKLGHYKIGFASDPHKRISQLNTASSTYSLEIVYKFFTCDKASSELIIHRILQPFRIKKRNEWFYLSNDIEINYAIHIIKTSIELIEKYKFTDYTYFQNYADSIEKYKLNQEIEKYTNTNFLSKPDKISAYNGVSWSIKLNKWTSRLTKNNNTIFLGYYQTEKEAAIAYNDYASYLNIYLDIKYRLNDINGYIPTPRNIPDELNKIKLKNKTSNFNGVYFIKSKQMFEASIQYKRKSYKLIKHIDDIECAKVYNEQALYFNNHIGTNYKLNDNIPNFITIEKNHIHELELNKLQKYSRFIGVSIRNDTNKFRAYIKYNGKRIDCGTFTDEIDAAKAYNLKAEELNRLPTTIIKYTLNIIN
jgi:hypothetical protein